MLEQLLLLESRIFPGKTTDNTPNRRTGRSNHFILLEHACGGDHECIEYVCHVIHKAQVVVVYIATVKCISDVNHLILLPICFTCNINTPVV